MLPSIPCKNELENINTSTHASLYSLFCYQDMSAAPVRHGLMGPGGVFFFF